MPELPEVETVRRGLQPALEGRVILRAEIRREGLRWPFPPDMAARLGGKRVLRLDRRAKYLLAALDSGETLIVHLGMSGRMLVSGLLPGEFHYALPVPEKHDHVVLHTDGGARVTFNDARRFGMMDLIASGSIGKHRLLAGLGPEPLGNEFHSDGLRTAFAGKAAPVKAALLDQRVVAGLGNIYVSEALWRAGIDPRLPARNVRNHDALVQAIRSVLEEALAAGGSSLRDHRQTNGELGYFQHSFSVYGRKAQPCPKPGCTGVVARLVQAGRATFHCPVCQKS